MKSIRLTAPDIPQSTYSELEFEKVLFQIEENLQNTKSQVLKSFTSEEEILQELHTVSEYHSSFENENEIIFRNFSIIEEELKTMQIEGYVLSADSFMKIKQLTQTFIDLQKSILKFQAYYPTLYSWIENIPAEKLIIKEIDAVFTKFGEVKNSASTHLNEIRTEKQIQQKKYQEQFQKSLIHYQKAGILNEIQESEIDGSRVLAVNATFKSRVKGTVRGTSKTGSIIFIEPDSVRKSAKEIQILTESEKKEIHRILLSLTFQMAAYHSILTTYQNTLLELDRIQAKARYAEQIRACLPHITPEKNIHLIEAYHPLLWQANHAKNENTIPQNIDLSEKQRIIVISGPNAGGKSITLKTVGLLQLMLQNGMLVPVNPKSTMSFFQNILTDIGDNQSIENHLSTYSSRLQRMAQILPKANENTLILIDEFGTGSDPELGGTLAETLLEYLYIQKSFCVVTTHYPNIKIKVEALNEAVNASMLFDKESLSPLYKLEIGQPGSSFTFEVAQKNKIPKKLIEIAKSKLVNDSKNLEETLVRMQQDKFELEQLKNQLERTTELSQQKKSNIEETEQKLLNKLSDFKMLYDQEQKTLQLGNKMENFIQEYSEGKTKKHILKEFSKMLEQEKFKSLQNPKKNSKTAVKKAKRKLQKDIEKKEKKIDNHISTQQNNTTIEFKKGMRVKIIGSSNVGTIEKIEKNKATINYGSFLTNISIFELEKV